MSSVEMHSSAMLPSGHDFKNSHSLLDVFTELSLVTEEDPNANTKSMMLIKAASAYPSPRHSHY